MLDLFSRLTFATNFLTRRVAAQPARRATTLVTSASPDCTQVVAAPGRCAGRARRRRSRDGFTLLEVMIATAVTMLMMLSLAQIFKIIGDSMQRGRAILELNNRLRSVTFRIRSDLQNLTIIPQPPTNPGNAPGYLKIYDGPMTDFSTTINPATSSSSRIGDCDDIIMGTIRADDTWFTGKVPRFVLTGTVPTSAAELEDYVTIASQYAELVIFAQPQVAISNANPDRDPSFLISDPTSFQDLNGDGIPDTYRLHYRLLLIRPDLNLPSGNLPGNLSSGLFVANPSQEAMVGSTAVALPPFVCDMVGVHSFCDLSVRRVFNPAVNGRVDFVAANSLADLVSPENRFAHIQVPINNSSTSMPLLALGNTIPAFSTQNGTLVGSGFLHPAYVLRGDRLGEDLLATDILAFDVKGFDEGVTLVQHLGANGIDDGGAAGSDDLVLSPNDPGFATLFQTSPSVVGTGQFVDLAWGLKMKMQQLPANTATIPASQLSGHPGGTGLRYSESLLKSGSVLISGGNLLAFQPSYDTWSTHFEGDGILQARLRGLDGIVRVNGAQVLYGASGPDDTNNLHPADQWRREAVDAGTDGIDNVSSELGVDDASEMETSAPYNIPLRGVQITVRMEDPRTRQIRQMSVAREFVNR